MSTREEMRERAEMFFEEYIAIREDGEAEIDYCLKLTRILDFAASEVALVLQPRDQSPELAEAEEWLRENADEYDTCPHMQADYSKRLAAELDRLRAEVARLTGEASRIKALLAQGAAYLRSANDIIMQEADGDEDDARDCSLLIQRMLEASRTDSGAGGGG